MCLSVFGYICMILSVIWCTCVYTHMLMQKYKKHDVCCLGCFARDETLNLDRDPVAGVSDASTVH